MSEENIRHVNYASDFRVVFSFPDGKLPAYPWHIELNTPDTPAYNTYVASFDGTTYHRCMPIDESSVVVLVDNHHLAPGVLCYRIKRDVPDSLFPDGEMNVTTPGCTSIELWDGVSEELPAEQINTIIALLKGDAGQIVDFTAAVDETTGTPNVAVTLGGTPEERTIGLDFSGLKGETPKITADEEGNIFTDGELLTPVLANAIKTFDTIESVDGKVKTEKDRAEGVERKLREDLTAETRRAKEAEQANAQAIETINNARGTANGLATLDSEGHVPASQLPSYVDDILTYSSLSAFPTKGEAGKIYVAEDTNLTYRWNGTGYTEISKSLALGETSSTAYPGDKGKKNADDIAAETRRATQAEGKLGQRIDGLKEKDPEFTKWKGGNAINAGYNSAAGLNSISFGNTATATGEEQIAMGLNSKATNIYEIALGRFNNSYPKLHFSVSSRGAYGGKRANCLEILDDGTVRINNLPNKEADGLGNLQGHLADLAGGGALRPLYEAMPNVKWNPETKMYDVWKEQGGISVTEEEMRYIYNGGNLVSGYRMSSAVIKVIIPFTDNYLDFEGVNISYSGAVQYIGTIYSSILNPTIHSNDALRKIVGKIKVNAPNIKLSGNKKIESISLNIYKGIDITINLAGAPNIDYSSFRYIPDNTYGSEDYSKTTTIQIDAAPYALLTGTATEEQYTATGHTKEEWMQIVTDSTAKGITFTKAL